MADKCAVALDIEHRTVLVGALSKEYAHRQQDAATEPDARQHAPLSGLGHLLSAHVHHVVTDEDEHADHYGQAQSALADDGSQGCSNEEEEQAGEAQGELLLLLHAVATQ